MSDHEGDEPIRFDVDEEELKEVEEEDDEGIEDENENDQSNADDGEKEAEDGLAEKVGEVKDEHFSSSKPEEFSSEKFKIQVGGMKKYYPLSQLKRLLNTTLQLDAHRVKPGGMGRNVCYVNFKSEEARKKALTVLEGYKWNESTLTACEAQPNTDPVLLAKIDFLKVPRKEYEHLPVEDRIEKAVMPYHDKSYENQLELKTKNLKNTLRKFGNELQQNNFELKSFVQFHKLRRKGQICEVDDFVESPLKEGYRNKCEFTIGVNKETEKPVVGFRVASYKEGSVEVGPVGHLKHLNDKTKTAVKFMEQFLETSIHKPYDPFTHQGVWRQLAVRTSQIDDLMLIVQIHPQELTEEEIEHIKNDFKHFFAEGDGVEAGVTSVFFQQCGQLESGVTPDLEHLHGKPYIEETILGKTFRAAPDAFLQVNTPACEKLYEKIAEVADIDGTTVLLDVCCGVGSIGISMAEFAYKVMGVESVSKAVENARENAEVNGAANAVFYNGRAEDYMENMLSKSQRSNVIAVVDPPRAGLNSTVMNALRKCEYLDKIVFVSCDLTAAVPNFINLGRAKSKTYKGNYFVPIRVVPVDMFPHTPHYETIVVFERYDECKWDRIIAGNPRPKDQEYFSRIPEMTKEIQDAIDERREKRRQRDSERRSDRMRPRRRGGDFMDERPPFGRDRRRDRYGDYRGRFDRNSWRRRDGPRYDQGGPAPLFDFPMDGPGPQQQHPFNEWVNRQNYGQGFQQGYQAAMRQLIEQQQSANQGNLNDSDDFGGSNNGGNWNSDSGGMDNSGGRDGGGGGHASGGMGGGGFNRNSRGGFGNNSGGNNSGGFGNNSGGGGNNSGGFGYNSGGGGNNSGGYGNNSGCGNNSGGFGNNSGGGNTSGGFNNSGDGGSGGGYNSAGQGGYNSTGGYGNAGSGFNNSANNMSNNSGFGNSAGFNNMGGNRNTGGGSFNQNSGTFGAGNYNSAMNNYNNQSSANAPGSGFGNNQSGGSYNSSSFGSMSAGGQAMNQQGYQNQYNWGQSSMNNGQGGTGSSWSTGGAANNQQGGGHWGGTGYEEPSAKKWKGQQGFGFTGGY